MFADGAQRAASKRPMSVSTEISSPVKARGDQRSWKSGSIVCSGMRERAAVMGASRSEKGEGDAAHPNTTERMESEAMSNPSIGNRTASFRVLAPAA